LQGFPKTVRHLEEAEKYLSLNQY